VKFKPLILHPVIWSRLLAIGATGCSEHNPETHSVRPIELKAMMRIVARDDFNGLVVPLLPEGATAVG
jgi:hypothetical protein